MQRLIYITIVILTLLITTRVWADAEAYPIDHLVDVQSENSRLVITTTAYYPNSCVRPLQTKISYESGVIILSHFVDVRSGFCLQVIMRNNQSVVMELPPNGEYQLRDSTSDVPLGIIEVSGESVRVRR